MPVALLRISPITFPSSVCEVSSNIWKYESIPHCARKGPCHLCLVVVCESFVVLLVQEVSPELLAAAQDGGDHDGAGGDTAQHHHHHHMLHTTPENLLSSSAAVKYLPGVKKDGSNTNERK